MTWLYQSCRGEGSVLRTPLRGPAASRVRCSYHCEVGLTTPRPITLRSAAWSKSATSRLF
jgi:hypothetical protein